MRFETRGASDVMKSMTRIENSKSKWAVQEGNGDGSPDEHCGQTKDRKLHRRQGRNDGDLAGRVKG